MRKRNHLSVVVCLTLRGFKLFKLAIKHLESMVTVTDMEDSLIII